MIGTIIRFSTENKQICLNGDSAPSNKHKRVVLFTKDSINDPEKGDTNNDGKLTINDVTKLVNTLLKKAE